MTDTTNELRAALLLAAIKCPHTITDDAVILHFDQSKPGHNALDQLGTRLEGALATTQQPAASAPEQPPCEGQSCGSTDGRTRSPECLAETDAHLDSMQPSAGVEAASAELVNDCKRKVDAYVGVVRRHFRGEVTLLDREWAWKAAMDAIDALATPPAPVQAAPLTDEQIDELAKPFIRSLGGDHWYRGEDGIRATTPGGKQ